MRVTRRGLVQGALAFGAARLPVGTLSSQDQPRGPQPSVLCDLTQCVGCHLCEVACQVNKGLPEDKTLLRFWRPDPSTPSENDWAVRRHQCMHCLDPACASVCPVAAMQKTPAGPVIYRDERCLGCRYCMNACPFQVPTFDWDSGLMEQALIRKCDFCADRLAQGRPPACVEACPTQAVIFGWRDELLALARERIAQHPDKYVNHIYGEYEAGGTSFLLLSGVPFAELGLPQPGDKALPELPETIMGGVVPFAAAWTVFLSAVAGLTRLRQRRQERQHQSSEPGAGPAGKEDAP